MGIMIEFELLMGNAKRMVVAAAPPSVTPPPEGSVLGERWGESVWITPEGWALKADEGGVGVEHILCGRVEVADGYAVATYRPYVWDGNRGGAALEAWERAQFRHVRVCQLERVWRSPPRAFGVFATAIDAERNERFVAEKWGSQWGTPQEVEALRKELLSALLG